MIVDATRMGRQGTSDVAVLRGPGRGSGRGRGLGISRGR